MTHLSKIDITQFISEFLSNFLSPQTKRAYIKDLGLFFKFLKVGGVNLTHPRNIEANHFILYRDSLIDSKLSTATIHRRLVSVRSFVKWANAHKLMDYNPLDAIKLPKISVVSPTQAFSDDEVLEMIAAPDIKTFKGNFHRMMMILLFNLGLRRSELGNIKLDDIYSDRDHTILKIIGKGSKERLIPLTVDVLEEIQAYLDRYQYFTLHQLTSDDYLLQSKLKQVSSKPIDGTTTYRAINRYAKILLIDKKVGPHSCRATVISHLLDTKFIPIRDVAHFAGHSNITTTERYDKKRKGLDSNAAYQVNFDDE